MIHLFSTTTPETLAPPQAPDTIELEVVPVLPDVYCNLDLTVFAPILNQKKVVDTWFSTHIELICSPTTAQIIVSDEKFLPLSSYYMSERKESTDTESDSDQAKVWPVEGEVKIVVDTNNNQKRVVLDQSMLGRGATVERGAKPYCFRSGAGRGSGFVLVSS
ncbi:unnamed protein product [Mytilus coruscus]|uniref:Uncharacterized protein n=1 Tax=Mytilus coruscus TaxID=42192 RepID=A0A6J8C0D5_MYTCO|nr:unnamed protein product [Mytilus coruscus]